jgi:asparagine synthetase B (glutamine-hydrolysing)
VAKSLQVAEYPSPQLPYIHIRFAKEYEVKGATSCVLGHELETGRAKPDGIFVRWHWDGDTLVVDNDRYGFYPLYYFATENEVCISPSLPILIAEGAPRELNESGLALFLRAGFFVGDDTPFRHIRALPPDAYFKWTRGHFDVHGNTSITRLQSLSRKEALNGYVELFKQSVRRRVPPQNASSTVLLTGGKDSRHILLELCDAGRAPDFCVTVNLSHTNDGEIAGQLSDALSVRHVLLPVPDLSVENETKRNMITSFCADEHEWSVDLADYMRNQVQFFYDGIGGDTLSNGLFLDQNQLSQLRSGQLTQFAYNILRGSRDPVSRMIAAKQSRKFSLDLAVDRLVSEVKGHLEAPNPVGSFYFWNRARREIALQPYAIFRAVQAYAPYLDHDVFDFLSSLPAETFLDHRFHADAIRRAYPRAPDLPYAAHKRTPYSGALWRFSLQVLSLLRKNQSELIEKSFVLPRILRCLIDPVYGTSIMWLGPMTVYILQIEAIHRGGKLLTEHR